MSKARFAFLRSSTVITCSLIAIVMLATFYSVVSGAVDVAAAKQSSASTVGAGQGASGKPGRFEPR